MVSGDSSCTLLESGYPNARQYPRQFPARSSHSEETGLEGLFQDEALSPLQLKKQNFQIL